jgi:hypothetical protein
MGIVLILIIVSNHRTVGNNINSSNFNNNRASSTATPSVAAIQLAGTTWAGTDSTGESKRYEFSSNGALNNTSSDRWQQSGKTVNW